MTTFARRFRWSANSMRKQSASAQKLQPRGLRTLMHWLESLALSEVRLTHIGVVLMLVGVVLLLSACQSAVVVKPQPYRPPAELMEPGKTQYLLPKDQQRQSAKPQSPASSSTQP